MSDKKEVIENVDTVETPGIMSFRDCLVRVSDDMRAIWQGGSDTGKKKRVVRVEFGFGFISDSLSRDTENHSEKEVIDFLETYRPYHSKRVNVTFSTAATRDGNYRNRYTLVDIVDIDLVSPTRRSSLASGAS